MINVFSVVDGTEEEVLRKLVPLDEADCNTELKIQLLNKCSDLT